MHCWAWAQGSNPSAPTQLPYEAQPGGCECDLLAEGRVRTGCAGIVRPSTCANVASSAGSGTTSGTRALCHSGSRDFRKVDLAPLLLELPALILHSGFCGCPDLLRNFHRTKCRPAHGAEVRTGSGSRRNAGFLMLRESWRAYRALGSGTRSGTASGTRPWWRNSSSTDTPLNRLGRFDLGTTAV